MSPAGSEATIPAGERPQTHVLNRVANGIRQLSNPDKRGFQDLPAEREQKLVSRLKSQLSFFVAT
jgi:hypothetical protein